MNFFDVQDNARRTSRRLVLLYLLATALIVAGVSLLVTVALFNTEQAAGQYSLYAFLANNASVLLTTAVVTALFIFGASLFKSAQLSAGGGRVARQMGGTLVSSETDDPLRRRLRNVVEEMAIASGVPVPEIYVLDQEPGINAFAAGYAPADAAVAVTRGALELLDRDELQGVIGHEFSHITNGDMRLNIRLMGILFGIMVLGLMGRMVFRGVHFGAFSSRRERGNGAIVIIGLGLIVLGAVGVFFARMIKAGVSRQRELLADASAVQFTRQTTGLASALKKIGGYEAGSMIRAVDPEEVSHMLFGTGSRLRGMFATHPPLGERIRALDPSFRESDYPRVEAGDIAAGAGPQDDQRAAGFTSSAGAASPITPGSISDSVGRPTQMHVAFATRIRESVPETLYDAAHSPQLSYLLAIALILDHSGEALERQLSLLSEQLGETRSGMIRRFSLELRQAGPAYRLPLLEIAFPALRQRPAAELSYLIDLTRRLIEIDGKVDLHEFSYYRVLTANLRQSLRPAAEPPQRRAGRKEVREAAAELLGILANQGHDSAAAAERAFQAGMAIFGEWGGQHVYEPRQPVIAARLEKSLDLLVALNGEGRQMLLDAVTRVVMHDRELTVGEAELVRTVCASLDIPLPPQIDVSWKFVSQPGSN